MTDWRRAKVLRNGEWHEIPFEDIRKGDTVRLFEGDGEAIMDGGEAVLVALRDAEPLPEPPGNYGFVAEHKKRAMAGRLLRIFSCADCTYGTQYRPPEGTEPEWWCEHTEYRKIGCVPVFPGWCPLAKVE